MAPRRCSGFPQPDGSTVSCCFHPGAPGEAAQGKFDGRCVWCSPGELGRRLASPQLKKLLVYSLLQLQTAEAAFRQAVNRIPEEHRQDILAALRERSEALGQDAVATPAAAAVLDDVPPDSESASDQLSTDEVEEVPLLSADYDIDASAKLGQADPDPELQFQEENRAWDLPVLPHSDSDDSPRQHAAEAPRAKRRGGVLRRPAALDALEQPIGPGLALAGALASQPMRRPAAAKRVPKSSERCKGSQGRECTFSTLALGQAATVQPFRKQTHCLFCSDTTLDHVLAHQRGAQVTKTLRQLKALSSEKYEEALCNLRQRQGDNFASDFAARVERAERKSQTTSSPAVDQWRTALQFRQRVAGALDRRAAAAHTVKVRRDRGLVRRKFFCPQHLSRHYTEANVAEELALAPPAADVAFNDSGLPAPDISERAKMAEQWCKLGSWRICRQCHSVRPRPFQPGDLRRVAQPTVKTCTLCRRGARVPQPGDVPEPLRELSADVVLALRPLDVDTGNYERAPHGYRVHASMVRFAWAAKDVETKIAQLSHARERKQAKRAFRYLTESEQGRSTSAYADFVERHRRFLTTHEDAAEQVRKRPLRFLEERALECALWPHLYWDTSLCETVVRLTDVRRQRPVRPRACMSSGEEDAGCTTSDEDSASSASADSAGELASAAGRHSVRRSFLNKVLGPIVGYSEDYELLHFVYDLVMWSSLGGTKNSASSIPLRLAVKKASWSPEYWRTRHLALLDLQRQVGLPHLFRTRAPYERSFPYHMWVLHEMALAGRGRLELAGPETLHMAHVLKELDRGYFSGMNRRTVGRRDRQWKDHLLAAADGSDVNTVLNFVSRLEFQDGKRKTGTQRYHGRGAVHSHSLDYLENVGAVRLHEKLSASVPQQAEAVITRGIVLDSQLDRNNSKVDIREEPSAWDDAEQKVLLHHTEEDHARHVRAYFPEALQVSKCHEDVLQADGHGALMRYVATYQQKFSGSFAGDWLNDEASDYSVARRILFDHHPLEPEMWLSLAGAMFPQFSFGGALVDIFAPYPGMEHKPDFVVRYETCSWRGESMTLLDFLRKSNSVGAILQWVRRKHKATEPAGADSVEEFARSCPARGEKAVAAACVSRLRDRYYGQWLALHCPFAQLDDFFVPEIQEKVPERYQLFATALHWRADYWTNLDQLRADMQLEACSSDHIETVCNLVRAQTHLVGRYLQGDLVREDVRDAIEEVEAEAAEAPRPADGDVPLVLDASQRRLQRLIDLSVQRSLDARAAEDDDALDDIALDAHNTNRILAAVGPPGSGKTSVIRFLLGQGL
ncbi:PIF1 [Symbiodinium sp. CCMP2592]|nr:PIF1 [Symbiodinium sp. CCMP2592]